MDHLLQRVTQLEKMVSELVNWTNYTTSKKLFKNISIKIKERPSINNS